ncbi:hypothetical protein BGW36DRAFT_462567 [Talaromyces proteolyticus]|uniref:RNase III domain-containing protein n=1 Tax=Talaromyces proteolyticus TaxID=1131652 RepID=A0AAD4PWA3_9EURO|nr:uncharacterized protein BGW36DRAFT_462567 [Talaromyces proteolyticus]KAH8694870.1 hypothetical protein BGW36DRAFT_462567 [Talaromyces proteolyticus]
MEGKIHLCEEITGHSIISGKLSFAEALNMTGEMVRFEQKLIQLPKNDRLAVYGDTVAQEHLCRQWLGTHLTKGQWTNIRNEILTNENLTRVGFQNGLDRCLTLNRGLSTVSPRMMATAVEAILGAVHRDGGDTALATVMDRLGLRSDLLTSNIQDPPH